MDNSLERAKNPFSRFASWVARRTGHPAAFLLAMAMVLAWAVTGPMFGFSDTWQLVINTATTIATFLMVFLIQNTQTRDAEAMHIKLDELIEETPGARRELLDLEEMPESELHRLQMQFVGLAAKARRATRRRRRSAGQRKSAGAAGRPKRGKPSARSRPGTTARKRPRRDRPTPLATEKASK